LVTFGIVPTGPETGYGYIQRGDSIGNLDEGYKVKCFVEKPNLPTAESYIASGEYYWNSGMFMFRAKKYLEELEKFRPDIYEACKKSLCELPDGMDFITVDKESFALCPDESVDYAVMEKTTNAMVVPLDAGWSDVGSWSALWEVNEKDTNNNALTGDVFLHNTEGCYINTDEKMVAAVGVKNLVIVNTKDALLVIDKSQVQDVKKVVEYLKINQRSEYKHHRDIYRPWGKSDLVVAENRFNVNRVTVNPGGKLSTQMHHHRAEHWIILAGTAQVTIGEKTFLLTENQSTFIPIGSIHTLENPGKIPLEILEVRSGSYLGNDDVIRIKDHYGRN
jgi:mannose-1-phosphate guanylyltransferase